ncbi:hypothetical protein [Endozoicomonas sp. SCSIO W0465]|uniref:hypothetical protein n=1 Tax=Endozoicomonas sp. SCSIO W0465 TaxID=2918516 RepID=UPI0020758833|nr:hypothetical protein [Endozoicomonas sp. SCSIO W0465]USE35755.1 hypothetical protein MJO57_27440 [Endozoicomonas sp. SCSIO W0465]USE38661.1 hypothetical protein MJO57_11105 [Endozoicomonas sp. SCSIO W0465]
MLANIVEKWCLRGWYKNQKIPDLCGGAEQLHGIYVGKGGTSGGGERTQYGVGGEVMVPVVEDLEVTLAGG